MPKELGPRYERGREPPLVHTERITDEELRFAELVATGNTFASAYRTAFHDEKGPLEARVAGYNMAQRPLVRGAIALLKAEAFNSAVVTAERVVTELAAVAFSDIGDIVDWDGGNVEIQPSELLKPEARRAIKAIKVRRSRRLKRQEGEEVEWEVENMEVQLWDKVDALKSLATQLGMTAQQLGTGQIQVVVVNENRMAPPTPQARIVSPEGEEE